MLQVKTSTANPYITQIRQSLQQTQAVAIDWLVLAHNDAQLLSELDEAFPESALAVIALPQNRWQSEDELLTEVVDWAVCELGVKGVVMVGHSQGGMPEQQVKLLGGKVKTSKPATTATNSLLERLKQAQLHSLSTQYYFAEQIERLRRATVIENRLTQNQMQLRGLFYRGESGTFCVYDQQRRDFKPLFGGAAVV
jgi:hypothetical protein